MRVPQTLIGRATRLESSASRIRLAAEKEIYRRTSAAKRRRASGPKNMSEFMRETIRNRKSQGKTRVAARHKSQDRPDTLAHPDNRDRFQKGNNNSSRIVASFVVPPRVKAHNDGSSRCSTPVLTKQYHGPMNHENGAWSAGGVGGGSPHSSTSSPEGCTKVRRLSFVCVSRHRNEASSLFAVRRH